MKIGLDYIGVTVNFMCHDGNGRFFFAKRSDKCRDEHGRWEMGGGVLDFGEDPLVAVRREMEEEFAIVRAELDACLGHTNLLREHSGQKTHWVCISYVFTIPTDEPKIQEPHKFTQTGWFTLDALPHPLHTGSEILINKYNAELRMLSNKT